MSRHGLLGRIQSMFSSPEPFTAPIEGPGLKKLRKDVCTGLVEGLQPILLDAGFNRFVNGTAWRDSEHWVDVLQIQFIRSEHTMPHSPALQLGRLFTFMPERDAAHPVQRSNNCYRPTPEQCHIRKTIFKPVHDRKTPPNIWPIGRDGEGLEQCIAQAVAATQEQIVPWCHWLDDPAKVLELVLTQADDRNGKSADPVLRGTSGHASPYSQHVLSGMLAVRLKRWPLADQLLAPLIERGVYRVRDDQIIALSGPALDVVRAAHAHAVANMQR